MQTDWGGEYEKLNSFFQKVGITHLVSYPHAHQQNSATERKHRHIVEVGLSLLSHASMPLKYWHEAYLAATYLINHTPTKILDFPTPLECIFSEKPDYSMTRVFGCTCWPNLRPYHTRKLAFRSTRCAFLGYSNLHKGFKCLDISTSRIYISRDVVFDENVFPFSELCSNAGATLRSQIELLPSHLFNFSTPKDMLTVCTDVANSSSNLPTNPVSNPHENGAREGPLHDSLQGATIVEHEADPPGHLPPISCRTSHQHPPRQPPRLSTNRLMPRRCWLPTRRHGNPLRHAR